MIVVNGVMCDVDIVIAVVDASWVVNGPVDVVVVLVNDDVVVCCGW